MFRVQADGNGPLLKFLTIYNNWSTLSTRYARSDHP